MTIIKQSAKVKFDHRGSLIPINISELPEGFGEIKRIMIIHGNKGVSRGAHAHHETKQYLVCSSGTVVLKFSNDGQKFDQVVLGIGDVFYHPNHEWLEMEFIEEGILVSLCSEEHSEGDYIKDLHLFRLFVKYNWNINKVLAIHEQSI